MAVCTAAMTSPASAPIIVKPRMRSSSLPTRAFMKPLHLVCDVEILSAHQLRPRLDDGHTAAEATVSLRHFEADIAASDNDQVYGQVIELERLNMGERPGSFETGNRRDCCAGS